MNFLDRIFDNLETKPELASLVEIHAIREKRTDGTGLLDLIARARAAIAEAGVKPGDRVAILGPNSTRWVAADLAILAQGGVIVPLYDRQDPNELAKVLRSSEPTLLLAADKELAASIKEAWPEHCEVALFDALFKHEPTTEPRVELKPESLVAIIYTSGTSGEPKGVMLDVANVDFMIPKTIERLGKVVVKRDDPDRVFHFLPLCFAASRMMLWTQISRPNPIMLSTDLTKLVIEMATAKPNYFLNVPAVLERIRTGVGAKVAEKGGVAHALYTRGVEAYLKIVRGEATFFDRAALGLAERLVFPKIKQTIGPNLDFLISGSAPLAEETQRWFQMLGIPVYQAYGLTETTGIVSLDEPDRVVPGRVGVALEGVETKVSEDGELLVRGPNVFRGYWNKDDETGRAIRNEWFSTGDQVDITDDNIKIIGRIKNLIIPESGHNIAPEPIEERFMSWCPSAEQCMIVGHGRAYLSIIVTGDASQADIDKAIEGLNKGAPSYKKIRKAMVASEGFTVENGLLTANQKLRRQVIEKHFESDIDGLYA